MRLFKQDHDNNLPINATHFFSGLSTFWEEKGILKMEYQMTYHETLPKKRNRKGLGHPDK